jgi:hypothetical protein
LLQNHFFFFASEETDINPAQLQKGPHRNKKLQHKPFCKSTTSSPMAPSVARRRSCSPHRLGSSAVPERTGSHQSPAPQGLHRRAPSSSSRTTPASSTSSSKGARSVVAQPRNPARGSRLRQLRRTASSTGVADRRRDSRELRHRRGDPPPAKPLRPSHHRLDAAGWVPNAHLHCVHGANRGSPVLPLPERPAEGEAATDSAPARWRTRGCSQNAS